MSISVTGGVTFSGGSLFTVLAVPTDAQFNYVAALFSGEGTNTAQNNTFLDGSTNNFSITRTGTPTQGSFSPYGSNWSNYFTSNSYLSISNNAAFNYSTGSFTIEAWVYFTSSVNAQSIVSTFYSGLSGATATGYELLTSSSGFLQFDTWLPSSNQTITATNNALVTNTWNHVAVVNNAGTFDLYVNGIQCTKTGTISQAVNTNGSAALTIGYSLYSPYNHPLTGYISNLRVVKGTAVYTSAFTPPTAPLTAISGTSLLTCQSNRFIDSSTNNFALTVAGTPSVQRYNPFGTAATYSTSTIGGAGYFNGSTDYLLTSSSQVIPTGSFTVEAWVYPTSSSDSYAVAQGTTGNAGRFSIGITSNLWYVQIGSAVINTGSVVLNQWTYLAATFNGTTLTLYVNGTSVGTAATSTNAQNTTLRIGSLGPADWGAFYWTGYIGQIRVSNIVRSISAPASPYSSDANTSFLLNYTNGGVYDGAMLNNAITAGAAQISTTQYKFGSSSISFNGTTSYLSNLNNSLNYAFGSGDFTIEFWLYASALPTNPASAQLFDTRPASTNGAYPLIYLYYDGTIRFYVSSADRITGSTISTSTWYHIAVCRSSGATKLFINGTQSGSTYTDSTVYLAGNALIGASYSGNPTISNFLNGYLDDIRVTKGYARYTSNFTAPTSAFPTLGPDTTTAPTTIEYLVVAGGGAGASANSGNVGNGGGGAGGLLTNTTPITTGITYTVTVGGGASPTAIGLGLVASNGNDSILSGTGLTTIQAFGGGSARSYTSSSTSSNTGGSGGGGTWTTVSAGSGTAGPPIQGYAGGAGSSASTAYGAGGGGGSAAVGTAGSGSGGGTGGAGTVSSISGTSTTYAGGGGGGSSGGTPGSGGSGGGGAGSGTGSNGVSGTTNTGGGGGGTAGTSSFGGSGGSGIVIIRYPASYNPASATTGSPSITLAGGYRVYKWTSSGSITF